MRTISKTLWASLFLLSTTLLIAWLLMSQSKASLHAKAAERHVARQANVEDTTTNKPASPVAEPTSAVVAQSVQLDTRSPLPQTATYYKWTDHQGRTGYSTELPERVRSFEAIVLQN
ncbi:MAG: DUF4124 domain-containing protein [Granulosicoccaceae bacterium]